MKRVFALLLCAALAFSMVACSNSNNKPQENVGVIESYQKLSYTDFNNFAGQKGYKSVENTDNSSIEFKRSFGISDDEGFNMLFYEVENTATAYTYFNYVLQTYESYSSEFSASQKYNDYGCYVMKDENVTLYIAFVENTIMYSLIVGSEENPGAKNRDKLVEFVKFVQYPALDFPEFSS